MRQTAISTPAMYIISFGMVLGWWPKRASQKSPHANRRSARLAMTGLPQSNICHGKTTESCAHRGKQRAVANNPSESCGSTKSSTTSTRAGTECCASYSNWKSSAWAAASRGSPPPDRGGEPRRGQLELVERLAEREQEKKLRDQHDVSEADRLRQQLKKRRAQPGVTPQQ